MFPNSLFLLGFVGGKNVNSNNNQLKMLVGDYTLSNAKPYFIKKCLIIKHRIF